MESTETIQYTIYPLKDGWLIEEIELSHTAGKDYWLAKEGSEKKQFLGSSKSAAFEKIKEIIGC